ncbi:MAG: hypothetical protein AAFQ41_15710 [Cyanobacteria bacterium J06623_7]
MTTIQLARLLAPFSGALEANGGGSNEKRFLEFGVVPQLQQAHEEASEDDNVDFDLAEILQADTSFADFESTVL